MAINRVFWNPFSLMHANTRQYYLGQDIHVLRNNTPTLNLRDYLWCSVDYKNPMVC